MLVFTSTEPCDSKPELVGVTRVDGSVDGSCVGVPFNTTYHEPIIAQSWSGNVRYVIALKCAHDKHFLRHAYTCTTTELQKS